jgi:AcrR family transcriptional regulator
MAAGRPSSHREGGPGRVARWHDVIHLGSTVSEPSPSRRGYDNRRRNEQSAQTRERIVVAATDLLHASSIRDWRALTIRAVADRAGVSERTVYRHFDSERGLRDAVMHRMEEEAGIDLESLRLGDVAEFTARTLRHVSEYPRPPKPQLDPTLTDANQRLHDALRRAVDAEAADWDADDRVLAAGVLDVLWSVASYERLAVDWHLSPDEAIRGLTWAVRLVQDAIADGAPMAD